MSLLHLSGTFFLIVRDISKLERRSLGSPHVFPVAQSIFIESYAFEKSAIIEKEHNRGYLREIITIRLENRVPSKVAKTSWWNNLALPVAVCQPDHNSKVHSIEHMKIRNLVQFSTSHFTTYFHSLLKIYKLVPQFDH